jgi:hypothetical protein
MSKEEGPAFTHCDVVQDHEQQLEGVDPSARRVSNEFRIRTRVLFGSKGNSPTTLPTVPTRARYKIGTSHWIKIGTGDWVKIGIRVVHDPMRILDLE